MIFKKCVDTTIIEPRCGVNGWKKRVNRKFSESFRPIVLIIIIVDNFQYTGDTANYYPLWSNEWSSRYRYKIPNWGWTRLFANWRCLKGLLRSGAWSSYKWCFILDTTNGSLLICCRCVANPFCVNLNPWNREKYEICNARHARSQSDLLFNSTDSIITLNLA